ncbi:fimbrial protein [Enterobacter hormaechei]
MQCKQIILAGWLCLVSGASWAANPDACYWWSNRNDQAAREYSLTLTSSVFAEQAPVGGNLATSGGLLDLSGNSSVSMKCPTDKVPVVDLSWAVEGAELAEGFTDVYQSGLKGVVIRLKNGSSILPVARSYTNYPAVTSGIYSRMEIFFVRTGRDVEYGQAQINITVKIKHHRWDAATLRIQGQPIVSGRSYFSGCSSQTNTNIAMGKVATAHLGKVPAKRFNLDLLCTGMPPGWKPPVNIYFEGDSPGAGRLRLTPGGAQGVELRVLQAETNRPLPFYKSSAMSMTWQSSQPGGELYRIPISAEYVIPSGQKPVAGRADAALNYILEYN